MLPSKIQWKLFFPEQKSSYLYNNVGGFGDFCLPLFRLDFNLLWFSSIVFSFGTIQQTVVFKTCGNASLTFFFLSLKRFGWCCSVCTCMFMSFPKFCLCFNRNNLLDFRGHALFDCDPVLFKELGQTYSRLTFKDTQKNRVCCVCWQMFKMFKLKKKRTPNSQCVVVH